MCEIYKESLRPVTTSEELVRLDNGETKLKLDGPILDFKAHRKSDGARVGVSRYDSRVQKYIKDHMETGEIDKEMKEFHGYVDIFNSKRRK